MSIVWPYCPMDGMLEGLAWSSDTLRARSSEQRIRLSDRPRRVFSTQYRFSDAQYEHARALLRGRLPGPFWLPEWSEAVRRDVSPGQASIAVDTAITQYASAGYAAIVRDGWGAGEVVPVSVGPSSITVLGSPGVVGDYSNALVAPAFPAYAPAGMEASVSADGYPLASIEWEVYAGTDIGEWSGPTYRGDPLLDQCVRIGAAQSSEAITRDVERVDNGIAAPFFDDMLSSAVQGLTAHWMPQDGAEMYELRQFFYYLHGPQKAFWLPGWNRGFALAQDIADTDLSIRIAFAGFAAGYGTGDLFLRKRDGTAYTLQVVDSVQAGDEEELTLAEPFSGSVSVADVDVLCPLFRVRLGASRVEFAHMAGYGASVAVPCVEVPLEESGSP